MHGIERNALSKVLDGSLVVSQEPTHRATVNVRSSVGWLTHHDAVEIDDRRMVAAQHLQRYRPVPIHRSQRQPTPKATTFIPRKWLIDRKDL